jgi:hypothetical protein
MKLRAFPTGFGTQISVVHAPGVGALSRDRVGRGLFAENRTSNSLELRCAALHCLGGRPPGRFYECWLFPRIKNILRGCLLQIPQQMGQVRFVRSIFKVSCLLQK